MANETESFCSRLFRNKPQPSALVLAGSSGVAKTHCLNCVSIFWRRGAFTAFDHGFWGSRRIPTQFMLRWPEAVSRFRANNFNAAEDAQEADLLLLDDIGAENDPWQAGVDHLCQILSRRERKFTMITTNIEIAAWQTKWDRRVADRLFRNSVVIELFNVPSYAIASRL